MAVFQNDNRGEKMIKDVTNEYTDLSLDIRSYTTFAISSSKLSGVFQPLLEDNNYV